MNQKLKFLPSPFAKLSCSPTMEKVTEMSSSSPGHMELALRGEFLVAEKTGPRIM